MTLFLTFLQRQERHFQFLEMETGFSDEEKLICHQSMLQDMAESYTFGLTAVSIPMTPEYETSSTFQQAWLHFRATDPIALDKYGPPNAQKSNNFDASTETYQRLHAVFVTFVSLDEPNRFASPLYVRITHPSGDEVYIRRLRGEELVKYQPRRFLVHIFPFARMGGNVAVETQKFHADSLSRINDQGRINGQGEQDRDNMVVQICSY